MGSSVSVSSGQLRCSENDVETFKSLQSAYEVSKDLENVELFNLLSNVYQTCKEGHQAALVDNTPAITETMKDVDAELERSKLFISACGAFSGGAAKANISQAKALHDDGVNVNHVDNDGWSALFHACGEGHIAVVEWLTEQCGADVELKDPDGCTPLWVAAFNNRRNVVQHLLRIGADDSIKAEPEGEPAQTPSSAARRNKHPGVADFIDDETALRAADPTRRDRQRARQVSVDQFRDSLRKGGGRQE